MRSRLRVRAAHLPGFDYIGFDFDCNLGTQQGRQASIQAGADSPEINKGLVLAERFELAFVVPARKEASNPVRLGYSGGRAKLKGAETVPSGFRTVRVAVEPGAIFLAAFLHLRK
jgi:hypothetical protein